MGRLDRRAARSRSRLTTGPHFDTGPAFSPTGKRIVFSTDRGSDFFPHLWVMKSDGTDRHLLYGTQFAESTPDWQPRSN